MPELDPSLSGSGLFAQLRLTDWSLCSDIRWSIIHQGDRRQLQERASVRASGSFAWLQRCCDSEQMLPVAAEQCVYFILRLPLFRTQTLLSPRPCGLTRTLSWNNPTNKRVFSSQTNTLPLLAEISGKTTVWWRASSSMQARPTHHNYPAVKE